jgi:putative transposase
VWQGRYYSCPLDGWHLWEALRYTELNPVRAFLVTRAPDWPWSSAAFHCGAAPVAPWLDMDLWGRRWSTDDWRAYLQTIQDESSLLAIRDSTYSGRPLGSAEFTRTLEKEVHRPLTPQSRVIPAIVSGTRKLHAETSSNFTLLGVRGPAPVRIRDGIDRRSLAA